MKSFQIKTSLAAGLAHRLGKLDPQIVIDACVGMGAIKAIRACQGVADKINLVNATFMDAVNSTEAKNIEEFNNIKVKYDEAALTLSTEELALFGKNLTAEYNKKRTENQKESTAQPDEIIIVTLSDDDYNKVLIPVFEKTAQLWDVNNDGNGQKLFLEVANAIEAATEV